MERCAKGKFNDGIHRYTYTAVLAAHSVGLFTANTGALDDRSISQTTAENIIPSDIQ